MESANTITTKERIFHSILFEVMAILLFMLLAQLVSDKDKASLGGLAIAISVTAMVWNYFFNIAFDKIYGHERISRTLKVRILHSVAFELGLIIATTPMIMWVLEVDLYTALVMDVAAMVIFIIFTIIFNWIYDLTRQLIVNKSSN